MQKIIKTTPEKRELFLDLLENGHPVTIAANRTGITTRWWYRLADKDPEFAAAWDVARRIGIQKIEDNGIHRAGHGAERKKPIFYRGQIAGYEEYIEWDTTLQIFMLKSHKPEVYRETTKHELSGSTDHKVTVTDDNPERSAAIIGILQRIGALPPGGVQPALDAVDAEAHEVHPPDAD